MNFFERRAEQLKRRLKNIQDNPDPSRMRSNALMYQVELERWQWLDEAWKDKKPFTYSSYAPLMRAMGFYNSTPRSMSDRAGSEMAAKCMDLIRQEGYPEMACDRAVIPTVMPMLSDFPVPAFIVVSNAPCEHAGNCYKALARQFKVPSFTVDVPFTASEASLKALTEQLREMAEYAAHLFPGTIKYDESKLIEYIDKDRQVFAYFRDIFQLLKRVPCPIDPREGFREPFLASNCPNPDHVIEWARARRDELYERAEKGVGALPEEKLRTIWLVTGYNNDRGPMDYLESRGVSVMNRIDGMGSTRAYGRVPTFGDEKQFGRKLSPLEEMARETLNSIWLGLGPRWVDEVVSQAKDLKCDFVINFIQSGCLQHAGLAQIIDETLKREGIPSLRIEGRSLFPEGYNRDEVIARFGDFIDMMLDRKGLPRR